MRPFLTIPQGWDCHVHVFDSACPVRAGHYQPAHRPIEEIESVAARSGVGHLVLVQPSVHGTDNRLLMASLARNPGRHRAVVVVDSDIALGTLQAMHAAGVRGVRFNLGSPLGEGPDIERRFDALAPHLRTLGWHLQWFAAPAELPRIAALHGGSGIPCVLDHLAGLRADEACHARSQLDALAAIADGGGWLKLSGWYRLGSTAPHHDLIALTRRLADRFGSNLVWGSDWPHTAFAPAAMPPYASTWQPVVLALGEARATILRQTLPAIYR